MQRSETRFLTTHTGSLIRPETLVKEPPADADAATRGEYERSLTAAVNEAVSRQADAGLDVGPPRARQASQTSSLLPPRKGLSSRAARI